MADEQIGATLQTIATNGSQIVSQLGKIVETITTVFPAVGDISSTASAGAATLPANPVAFLLLEMADGSQYKLALYGV